MRLSREDHDIVTAAVTAAERITDGEIVPVPEPATWVTGALLVTATVGMSLHRIRRRRALAYAPASSAS